MPFQHSGRANLAHWFRPSTARHATKSTDNKGADYKSKDDGFNVEDTISFRYVKTYPSSSSPSCCDDTTDWVIVQTDKVPRSNCSDDVHSYAPGQEELTATNVQLFDSQNNGPPSACEAGDDDRCRPCPECRRNSAKTHASIATQESHDAGNARHLDPCAPVRVNSYEFDVFAVGAWAMEAGTGIESAYNYPRTFF